MPFIGLWIDGSAEILEKRLRERLTDASDATAAIVSRSSGPAYTASATTAWPALSAANARSAIV